MISLISGLIGLLLFSILGAFAAFVVIMSIALIINLAYNTIVYLNTRNKQFAYKLGFLALAIINFIGLIAAFFGLKS